jgi:hypothetical protein
MGYLFGREIFCESVLSVVCTWCSRMAAGDALLLEHDLAARQGATYWR